MRYFITLLILFSCLDGYSQKVAVRLNALPATDGAFGAGVSYGRGNKSTVELAGSLRPWKRSEMYVNRYWLIQPEYKYWTCQKFNGFFWGGYLNGAQFNVGGKKLPFGIFADLKKYRYSCGDAVPVFQQNADKPYNVDLMQVIKTFGDKGKMMIGHCAGAMMFDFTGITKGKKVAVHPLAKPAIQNGTATDKKSEIDGNFFTAQDENTIWTMMPQVIEALK